MYKRQGKYIPPIVYCDVYINNVFYKTFSKNSPANVPVFGSINPLFRFDIQDSIQEALGKELPPYHLTKVFTSTLPVASVKVKFRSTSVDAAGLLVIDGPVPLQGTKFHPATTGGGAESNTFYTLNATIQHEANQVVKSHLNNFKTGLWNNDVYPLTHRVSRQSFRIKDGAYFPVLNLSNNEVKCVRINYRRKGEIAFQSVTQCFNGSSPSVCTAISVSLYNFPDAVAGQPYSYSIPLSGTTPITIISQSIPGWMSAAITGNDLIFSGTPALADVTLSASISVVISNACSQLTISDNIEVLDTAPACIPVAFSGSSVLPEGTVGDIYSHSITLSGTAPFALTIGMKPSWMTIAVSGSNVTFTGTPDTAGTFDVSFDVSNCGGSGTYTFSSNINIDPAIERFEVHLAAGNGRSIQIVSPAFFVFSSGDFPMPPDLLVAGTHSGTTSPINVQVTGFGNLKLFKNNVLQQTINVVSDGTYAFTPVTFSVSDYLKITYE